MTVQERSRLLVITLLGIERDHIAEQFAMIGCGKIKAAPMVVRGNPITRLSTSGLTDKTLLISS
jgi:hypothetical protein